MLGKHEDVVARLVDLGIKEKLAYDLSKDEAKRLLLDAILLIEEKYAKNSQANSRACIVDIAADCQDNKTHHVGQILRYRPFSAAVNRMQKKEKGRSDRLVPCRLEACNVVLSNCVRAICVGKRSSARIACIV